jgi:hypothetical protein
MNPDVLGCIGNFATDMDVRRTLGAKPRRLVISDESRKALDALFTKSGTTFRLKAGRYYRVPLRDSNSKGITYAVTVDEDSVIYRWTHPHLTEYATATRTTIVTADEIRTQTHIYTDSWHMFSLVAEETFDTARGVWVKMTNGIYPNMVRAVARGAK